MNAWATLNAGLVAAAAAATVWLAVARRLYHQRTVPPWMLGAIGTTGFVFGLAVVMPTAAAIARWDLPRTPAALLLVVGWGLVAGTALAAWGGTPLRPAMAVILVAGSALPTGLAGTAVGAVGGAVRMEKACMGNLKAVGAALREYVHRRHRWPAEARWVDELIKFLPYPRAFRCPARVGEAYRYVRPLPADRPDTAIIVCPHRFVGKAVVLRKDFEVEERPLSQVGR